MDDKTILALVDKFGASDLGELEFSDGTIRLALRRTPAAYAAALPAPAPVAGSAAAPAPVHLGLPASAEAAPSAAAGGEVISSPIVATFYRSPGPDSPSFVEVGSKVKKGQTLCILEAMKMMNHLEAEFDCEILSIKAGNGDLVEYGQALFDVRRS